MQSSTTLVTSDTCDRDSLIFSIRSLLEGALAIRADSEDENLIRTGVLDSLNLVRLVTQVEERFELQVPIDELGLESFGSIAAIADLIIRHRTGSTSPKVAPDVQPNLSEEIRRRLKASLFVEVENEESDLFAAGLLDSMSLVQLILELESHFELTLQIQELEIAEFRSIASMRRLIERRRRAVAR